VKISKQSRREAKQLFRSCLTAGGLDEPRVKAAIQQVLQIKPRGYLAILSHFTRLVKLEIERRTARVETATPLPPDLQPQVQANLSRAYGAGLIVSFAQNPALIGGMRIKVGSDVYDGSVQARLAALQESF
jgi:F-type H+-transporting ATPase subunit delta